MFVIRGQDVVGADAVRAYADLVEELNPELAAEARDWANVMEAWPEKKVPD